MRAGLTAAIVVNLFRRKGQPVVQPGDFFGGTAPKRSTWQEQLAYVEMLHEAFKEETPADG